MNTHRPAHIESVERDFGRAVQHAREAQHWKQSDLALYLGEELGRKINQPTIARLEKGDRPTPLSEVYAISKVLGVPVSELLPQPETPLQAMSAGIARIAKERMNEWLRLNDQVRLAYSASVEANGAERASESLCAMYEGEEDPDLEIITDALEAFTTMLPETRGRGGWEDLVATLELDPSIVKDANQLINRLEAHAEHNEYLLNVDTARRAVAELVAKAVYEHLTGESMDNDGSS